MKDSAGVDALGLAAAEYERHIGYFSDMPLNVFQVPHHGSHNNVSPSLLDRIIGPIGSVDSVEVVMRGRCDDCIRTPPFPASTHRKIIGKE